MIKQNHPFCRLRLLVKSLDTSILEPTNQNAIKVLKGNSYKTLGNYSPMSPQSTK